ncbi:hypothetical protein [Paenibacillus sp. KS-LC4]
MAGKQVVFKPDEVRRLQQLLVRIGADTDELRRRVTMIHHLRWKET